MNIPALDLAWDLAQVEDLLHSIMTSRVPVMAQAGQHLLRSGGKRFRPALVLASFRAAGGHDTSRVIPLAAAVELLHTASLIHDDINDRSDTRRGQITVNARWGNTVALLAGDLVFVKLLRLLGDVGPGPLDILGEAAQALIEGETLQNLRLWDVQLTEADYMQIVSLKTAALFAASAELGALAADASQEKVAALREYGYHLGVAFQLRDDSLDLTGRPEVLGKPVGSDLAQGKFGLTVIRALQLNPDLVEPLRARDLDTVTQAVLRTGATEYANARVQEHARQAEAALESLPAAAARSALQGFIDLAIYRDK